MVNEMLHGFHRVYAGGQSRPETSDLASAGVSLGKTS